MTDQDIIAGMYNQPGFTDGLMAQIGEIKSTKIDHESKEIHFFGQARNCTFNLSQVLCDLEAIHKTNSEISFK